MEKLLAIALNFKKGIGPRSVKSLVERFGSLKSAVEEEGIELEGEVERAKREIERAEEEGVDIIAITESGYPELLRQIPDPPPVLYVKGRIPEPCISVVGSRRTTPYGRRTAYRIGKFLSENGIATVSGLAYGVDTHAHRGAVDGGGGTVAVLGCGIDVDYPAGNRDLRRRIEESGAVISEFPFGTEPLRENFPRRNRVVSGLSYATIVVEARERSGSLITASLANEQGRVVFAVPGNIDSQMSRGTNLLIRDGASPLTEMDDIFRELPFLKGEGKEREIPKELEPLVEVLSKSPLHVDRIVEILKVDYGRAVEMLLELEMMGIVRGENGVYSLC